MNSRTQLPWTGFLVIWVVGTLFWAAAAIEAGMSIADAFKVGGVQMGIAAAMGMGIWALSARFPWQPKSWRFLIAHLVTLAVFATVYTASQALLYTRDMSLPRAIVEALTAPIAGWQMFVGVMLYLAIAGVSYARRAEASLRESERARAEARVTARDAQLAALHAQLQPHFLFNALHTVSALVHTNPERADRALDELGQMLRYALREPSDDVTLRQEWSFARDYLAFETLRLGPRLRLDLSIDEAALDARVPSFLLQPLVENAVRHGAAANPDGGDLSIRIGRQNGSVRIEVHNTAPGKTDSAGMAGSGLKRLRERLDLRYGANRSTVAIVNPSGAFTVTVTLPADDTL